MEEKICRVTLTVEEAMSAVVTVGFEKNGAEVTAENVSEENGKKVYIYALAAGCYRCRVEGEGYYAKDKDFVVSEEEAACGEKTLRMEMDKMAGTGWEPRTAVREFTDARVAGEVMKIAPETLAKYDALFTTPSFSESKAKHEFTTQAEMEAYIAEMDKKCPYMHVYTVAKSRAYQQNIYAIVFTETDLTNAETIEQAAELVRADGKVTIQDQAQIHGSEQSAGEGALVMLQQLCGDYGKALLRRVNIVLFPRISVDAAKDHTYTPPQQGNINRDYFEMNSVEIPALVHVYNIFQPEIVVDQHEFFTVHKYFADVKIGGVDSLNLPMQLRDLQGSILDYEINKLREEKLRPFYYRSKSTNCSPVTGRGTYAIRGSISILLEIPGVRIGKLDWKRRVLSQYLAVRNIFDYTAAHAEEVQAVVAQTRIDIAKAGETFDPVGNQIYLQHKTGTPFYLHCPTYSLVDGSYLGDETAKLAKFDRPTLWRARPLAYVIPKSAERIARILEIADWQGISYREVGADESLLLRQYRGNTEAAALNDEQEYTFESGAWLFPMNQVTGVVLALLMEPDMLDCTQGAASFAQQGLLPVSDLYRCEHME